MSDPSNRKTSAANSMWGGRFSASPAEIMQEINASIGFDKRLAPQDIAGSKAHAAMLADRGIITHADAAEIRRGLGGEEREDAVGVERGPEIVEVGGDGDLAAREHVGGRVHVRQQARVHVVDKAGLQRADLRRRRVHRVADPLG